VQILKRRKPKKRHVTSQVAEALGFELGRKESCKVLLRRISAFLACYEPEELVDIVAWLRRVRPEDFECFLNEFKEEVEVVRSVATIKPWLFLGSAYTAARRDELKALGITHVLNCTGGIPNFYESDFTYLKLHLHDDPQQSLADALPTALDFIEQAHGGEQNRVFVHCQKGVSRSVAIVIAYLKAIDGLDYPQALASVRRQRSIARPNDGFAEQLGYVPWEQNIEPFSSAEVFSNFDELAS